MAIKVFERYGPRANPADGNYPNGSFKNESVPGANDGTPLEVAQANDMQGFTDALLAEAGIDASGNPDTAVGSQRLNALKKINDGRYSATFKNDSSGSPVENMIAGRIGGVVSVIHVAGNVYSTGGTDWRVNTVSGVDLGGGLFAIHTSEVSIYDWGVTGKGLVNDYPAIEDANAYLRDNGGGTLVDGAGGNYLLSNTFIPYHNVSLKFSGVNTSIFKANHAFSDVVATGRPLPYLFDAFKQSYEGFKVVPAALGVNSRGFVCMRNLDCTFKNIWSETPTDLKNTYRAFDVSGAVYTSSFNDLYANVEGNPVGGTKGVGFHIGNGENEVGNEFAKTNNNTFTSCGALSFLNNWHLDTCRGTHLIDCNAEKSTGAAFLDTGGEFNVIEAPWAEITSGLGLEVKEGTFGDGEGNEGGTRPSSGLILICSRRNIGDIKIDQSIGATITKVRPGATLTLSDANSINTVIEDCVLDQTAIVGNGSGTVIRSKIGDEYKLEVMRDAVKSFSIDTFNGGFSFLGVDIGEANERGLYASANANTEIRTGFRGLEIKGDAPWLAMPEISSQPTPAAGLTNLYFFDNGGTTELRMRDSSGAIIIISTF